MEGSRRERLARPGAAHRAVRALGAKATAVVVAEVVGDEDRVKSVRPTPT